MIYIERFDQYGRVNPENMLLSRESSDQHSEVTRLRMGRRELAARAADGEPPFAAFTRYS